MTTSGNEWQRVVQRVTLSDNEWQRVTTNDTEWQQVVILVNFLLFRIREEPTTMHSKENPLNIEDDLEDDQASKRKC